MFAFQAQEGGPNAFFNNDELCRENAKLPLLETAHFRYCKLAEQRFALHTGPLPNTPKANKNAPTSSFSPQEYRPTPRRTYPHSLTRATKTLIPQPLQLLLQHRCHP